VTDTAKLNDEQKAFVVEQLALYYKARGLAAEVEERYGIKITPQAIEWYDPTKYAGRSCPKKWADLFHETRKRFNEGKADIAAANKFARIRWREQLAHEAWDAGERKIANEILDSIAKEMGEGFSNSGPDGAPLTATINITGRPEPAPAPQAMGGVRKPRD
jgi:hypothetical protein